MALPRLEPFTHADGDLVASIAGWAYLPTSGGAGTQKIQIVSNRVYNHNAAFGTTAYDTLNTYNNDQYAQIVYHNTGTGYIGVAVRCDTANPGGTGDGTHRTCYFFEATAGDRYFAKKVANVETQLGDDAGTPSDGDVLRIEASGTTIGAKVNGTQIFSVTDSSIASGSAGIFGEGDDANSVADDWEGGNLAVAGQVPYNNYYAPVVTQ
jgi:hypothetical protein